MKMLQSNIVKSLIKMSCMRLIKKYAKNTIFEEIRSFFK